MGGKRCAMLMSCENGCKNIHKNVCKNIHPLKCCRFIPRDQRYCHLHRGLLQECPECQKSYPDTMFKRNTKHSRDCKREGVWRWCDDCIYLAGKGIGDQSDVPASVYANTQEARLKVFIIFFLPI